MSDTNVNTSFTIDVSHESESHFFAGLTGDVASRGGLFVSTYKAIPVGAPVRVTANLPTGSIDAEGIVSWVREVNAGQPPGIGIAFEDLTTDQIQAIQAFCEERPPLYIDLGDRPSFI